jgi:hypothetical protein
VGFRKILGVVVMKIFGPIKYQGVWFREVMSLLEYSIPNFREVLTENKTYLGINPNSGKGSLNSERPHTTQDGKQIVIPDIGVYEKVQGDNGVRVRTLIWLHEFGHVTHILKDIDWEEWAYHTGRDLDLKPRIGSGNYWYVPAYEQFANDIYGQVLRKNLGYYYRKIFNLTW